MFSERYQYSDKRQSLQREALDQPVRVALWNLVVGIYFKKNSRLSYYPWMEQFAHLLYTEFMARPVIDVPVYSSKVREEFRVFFLEEEWFRIYDFLEFVAAIDSNSRGKRFAWHNPLRNTFVHYCNVLLERHATAYRFVGIKIQEITDPEEVKLLQEALQTEDDFVRVRLMIRAAFESLTSDTSRNYRTSIVEALQGLDLLSDIILERKGVSLGGLIDMLPLDSRLVLSLKTLFNHRQEGDTLYHPLLDGKAISFHDAKFFLVMAIGLCNYISSFDKETLENNAVRTQQSMERRTKVATSEVKTLAKNLLDKSSFSSDKQQIHKPIPTPFEKQEKPSAFPIRQEAPIPEEPVIEPEQRSDQDEKIETKNERDEATSPLADDAVNPQRWFFSGKQEEELEDEHAPADEPPKRWLNSIFGDSKKKSVDNAPSIKNDEQVSADSSDDNTADSDEKSAEERSAEVVTNKD